MNTNTNTNTNNTNGGKNMNTNTKPVAIAYKTDILRSNEKVVVYDIRKAFIDNDTATALSSIKTWLAMVDKDNKPTDEETVKMYDALAMVIFQGKNATVKPSERQAVMMAVSSSRVKAWLYTIRRENYAILRKEAKEEIRPEEKQGKAKKTTVKVPVAELEAFRAWKAMQEKAQ